ncbi:kinesin protein KIN-14F [Trifolium repens]|nr:kinesin protein KIN-14F [Trifolium repens]
MNKRLNNSKIIFGIRVITLWRCLHSLFTNKLHARNKCWDQIRILKLKGRKLMMVCLSLTFNLAFSHTALSYSTKCLLELFLFILYWLW